MTKRTLDLSQGAVEYEDVGSGPAVVLLHGLLVDGSLWRDVVPLLARDARVVVPELPLGCHRLALAADAPLAPPDVARLVADLLATLDLRDVTLVGNDTGGAIAQLVAAEHPERIGRLVLTPCDLYENFLPPLFRPLQLLARVPVAFGAAMQTMRVRALRRTPAAYGWLMRRFDAERVDGWVRAMLANTGARRDVAKVLRGISARQTVAAAERLRTLGLPVLLAWAPEDRSFKLRYAERMAAEVPGARLERIDDALTFVPVDQPARTAELIAGFVREGRGTPAPVAPTERLVVGGLYRYVRNPMYEAVAATIVGQALILGRPGLLLYAAVFVATVAAFVQGYEEPTLASQFGTEYEAYRRAVPRWIPRLRPWTG